VDSGAVLSPSEEAQRAGEIAIGLALEIVEKEMEACVVD